MPRLRSIVVMRDGLARTLLSLLVSIGVGCSSSDADSPPDVALDAGATPDSGTSDGGNGQVVLDAGTQPAADGGVTDSAVTDGAVTDSGGTSDSGATDSGASSDSGANADAAPDSAVDSGPPSPPPLLAVGDLPWPTQTTALPACTSSGLQFSAPQLEQAGRIAIEFSAPLQPSGVVERLQIQVLTLDDETDGDYDGTLVWSLPAGVELVNASAVVAGLAEASLRFSTPGVARVQLALTDDPRSGYAEVLVYAPQLPIWELAVSSEDLDRIIDDPNSNEQLDATLSIDGKPHATKVRLHGGSSRYYPKKSFRFDLLDAADGTWGTHLVLRAEFNDKTQLRNWIGMHLFSDGTWLPTPRSQLVHFRINGQYYGVMNNVERIDGQFLTAHGLRSSASLYEADPPEELASPGGNLTAFADPALYRSVYVHHGGSIDYNDLRKLIEQTLVLPAAEFEQTVRQEVMLDDELVYLAMMAALQNLDCVRKNYYIYRDIESPASSAWRVLPWDLDLTLGHLWSEENDVFEEDIVTDSDIFMGTHVPERGGFYNQLADRVLNVPAYRVRFVQMLDHIIASSLTHASAQRLIANALCRATPDLLADTNKRAENAEYLGRVDEIYDFIAARAQYIGTPASGR